MSPRHATASQRLAPLMPSVDHAADFRDGNRNFGAEHDAITVGVEFRKEVIDEGSDSALPIR